MGLLWLGTVCKGSGSGVLDDSFELDGVTGTDGVRGAVEVF